MPNLDDLSDNELDAFEAGREKIALDDAGEYAGSRYSDDQTDEEEEVMALKSQSETYGDDLEASAQEDEDEEENAEESTRWGSKKAYYGGDDESDDEDRKQITAEALRQQRKHLEDLAMNDYMDEDMMEDWKRAAKEHDAKEETPAGLVVDEGEVDFENLDAEEKQKYLAGSFPEFTPLVKEFLLLSSKLKDLQEAGEMPAVDAKVAALSTYLSTISQYFALFTEKLHSKQHFSMKEHTIMSLILSAREIWWQASKLSDLAGSAADDVDSEEDLQLEDALDAESVVQQSDSEGIPSDNMPTDSESGEDDADDAEEESSGNSDSEIEIDISKNRVASARNSTSLAGDYTESAAPDAVDAEEKSRRKKSLRFYTSKIDHAAQKNARKDKFTGDDDVPYKERLFERQQKLIEEARKRGLGLDKDAFGDDLDGEEAPDREDSAQDGDAYYESVLAGKQESRAARKAAHEEAKRAARDGTLAQLNEVVGADGKRALNFQILKNKGLTPHRHNDSRNARVKKRKKYEQAKKKLKSVRAVYDNSKRGPYAGEATGIKKGISRSVKFQ